jgi:hypothetical protein
VAGLGELHQQENSMGERSIGMYPGQTRSVNKVKTITAFLGKLPFPGKVKEGGMAANLFLTGDLTILASCHF